jgi:ribosomal subunit interface protein
MQILTTGKNLDIGEALRKRIETRLTGNLAKYFDGTVRAHVVVELQKSKFHTDCTLHLSTGLTLQAHGEDTTANSSFDMAAERLEKQLRRYKRRLRDYHPERRGAADEVVEAPAAAFQTADETQESETQETESGQAPAIIAEPVAEMSELTVGEAVNRLDTSELPFIVFRNCQHGAINVVYRRRDGLIGWIDPGTAEE